MVKPLRHRIEEAVRPRVPVAALPAVVRLRGKRARATPAVWDKAQRHMRFLMGAAEPDTDFDDLTKKYVRLMMWRGEFRWHPELITRQRVEGFEHLQEAHARGRGVIVNFMHHGFYDGLFGSISRLGIPVAAVATPSMFTDRVSPWLRQQHAVISLGTPAINAATGKHGVIEALRRGRAVGIATDVPSQTEMTFLGRTVRGASGAARIAHETDTPLVMVTSHPDSEEDARPAAFLRVARALDPSSFESPRQMLDTMLRHHERAITRWPHASDQPLARWRYDDDVPSE